MKRIGIIIFLVALALMAGCAGRYYPEYAKGQATAAQAAADTQSKLVATLGEGLKSADPGARMASAMGLAFMLAQYRPVQLEQPRPGPIEQGIGKMLPSLPMWAGIYGMFTQSVKNAGSSTHVEQGVSGNGAGGLGLGAGETSAATSIVPVPLE